jgi:hypothetical protein
MVAPVYVQGGSGGETREARRRGQVLHDATHPDAAPAEIERFKAA